MILFRRILAVLAGYLVYAFLLMGAVLIGYGDMLPGPHAVYVVISVVMMLFSIFAGGWVAGQLAPIKKDVHGGYVGALILIITVISIFTTHATEPLWYRGAVAALALPIAYFGSSMTAPRRVLERD